MEHPAPRREQTIDLSWTPRIDLTRWDAIAEVGTLARLAPGRRVIIHVGSVCPWEDEVDDRLPWLLAEAASHRRLQLELQGTLEAIRDWWQSIRHHDPARDAAREHRNLHAVR